MTASARWWRATDGHARDAGLAALLCATIALYLAALPLTLGSTDEGHTLHEAKRLLDGEVMYRDVFDLSTPGWVYLMAGFFRLFGTTLATARLTAAAIQGAIAALVFLACRSLAVRPTLAWVCGFAYVVVCQPLFPVASYHWLATLLSLALLLLCLRWRGSASWAFATGVAVGLLIAVHQQRGVTMGLAVAAFIVAQPLMPPLRSAARGAARPWRQVAAFAGGVLLVAMVAPAGGFPVWRALVIQPLVNYRATISCAWGFEWAGRTTPRGLLLKYLPVVLAFTAASFLAPLRSGGRPARLRGRALLVLFGLFSMLSIAYYPDVIHIAVIAPILFVALADAVETALRLLPPPLSRAVGASLAVAIVLAGGAQMSANLAHLRAQNPVAYQSAFGRIDLPSVRQRDFWTQLRAVVDAEPSHGLYCYPSASYTHLLSGARNPTRFEFVIPWSYTSPEQVQEVVDTLASSRPRYVLGGPAIIRANDPIAAFIRERYERVQEPPLLAGTLWRRKDGS